MVERMLSMHEALGSIPSTSIYIFCASLVAQTVKNLPTMRETQISLDPWVGKIPWRREWLHTPVFLPGESHRHRSLAGHSPWGRKESDTTEQLSLLFFSLSVRRTVWGESLVVLLPVCSLTFRTYDRKLWQLLEATGGDTAHWVSRQEFLPTISQESYILANAK